jgi:hypothetical protein
MPAVQISARELAKLKEELKSPPFRLDVEVVGRARVGRRVKFAARVRNVSTARWSAAFPRVVARTFHGVETSPESDWLQLSRLAEEDLRPIKPGQEAALPLGPSPWKPARPGAYRITFDCLPFEGNRNHLRGETLRNRAAKWAHLVPKQSVRGEIVVFVSR